MPQHYPQHVKERAKSMYILEGTSYNEIARILKAEYPKISAQNIKNWADAKDEHGETWHDKKTRKNQHDEKKIILFGQAKRKPLVERLLDIEEKIATQIEEKIESGEYEPKVAELATIRKLITETQIKWDPEGVAEQLLNILYEDPILGKVLEKRAQYILPKMSKLFGHNEKEINPE